jgi:hypothetical protein
VNSEKVNVKKRKGAATFHYSLFTFHFIFVLLHPNLKPNGTIIQPFTASGSIGHAGYVAEEF